MQHSTRKLNMIESQLRPNNIIDENLIAAFEKVQQEDFLPDSLQNLSYIDDHIKFSKSSFILKPLIFAKFLNIIKPDLSDVILEVGSGGGYTTSILANLVNSVYSIEQDKNIYDLTIKNIKNSKNTNVNVLFSNYRQLNILELKFNKIIVNGTVNADPLNLLDKLNVNGKLICILKDESSSNIYLFNKKPIGYEKLNTIKNHEKVDWVSYAGLNDSDYKSLAKKYCPNGTGAVFTFGLKGGYDAGVKLVNGVEMFSHLANIGDAKSLIIHPASTTHSQLTDEQQEASGAGKDVVRLSIGIEDVSDIIGDLKQALDAI